MIKINGQLKNREKLKIHECNSLAHLYHKLLYVMYQSIIFI